MRRYLFIVLTIFTLCFTANAQKTENFRHREVQLKPFMEMNELERKLYIQIEVYRLQRQEIEKKQRELKIQRSLA